MQSPKKFRERRHTFKQRKLQVVREASRGKSHESDNLSDYSSSTNDSTLTSTSTFALAEAEKEVKELNEKNEAAQAVLKMAQAEADTVKEKLTKALEKLIALVQAQVNMNIQQESIDEECKNFVKTQNSKALKALKEKSRKVWVSFGIFRIMLPFMDGYQAICLQNANKFCYKSAISRVQMRIPQTLKYFTWSNNGPLKDTLLTYQSGARLRILKQESYNAAAQTLDTIHWNSCQVDNSQIFQAKHGFMKCRMLIKKFNIFSKKQISSPRDSSLNYPSICAVNAKFIYLTGGRQYGYSQRRCQRYDIELDRWLNIQPMRQERTSHSSCHLAGFIYVFCGYLVTGGQQLNSVEKLAIAEDRYEQIKQNWQMIPKRQLVDLPQLISALSAPLNDREILILGGQGYHGQNVQIYDTQTDKCKSVAVTAPFDFNFYNQSDGNYSIANFNTNKVVALGWSYGKPYFIKFVKETSTITILDDFGANENMDI